MPDGFSFPDRPSLKQVVTGPGGQLYSWDGNKWVFESTAAKYVEKAGDAMLGPLFLNADATQAMNPVTYRQLVAVFGALSISITETIPPNPRSGQLWFDPVSVQLFIFYNNQWVVVAHPPPVPDDGVDTGGTSTGPSAGATGPAGLPGLPGSIGPTGPTGPAGLAQAILGTTPPSGSTLPNGGTSADNGTLFVNAYERSIQVWQDVSWVVLM